MKYPWLVADIGEVNARFGLVETRGAAPVRIDILSCRDHAGLSEAAATYLARNAGDVRPGAACVALPGEPVWSPDTIRAGLPVDHVELINDSEALALALPSLGPADLRPIGAAPPPDCAAPMAVLVPGAGLGVAALIPAAPCWIALSGPGGHADPPVRSSREREVVRLLSEQTIASAETLLSAPGLARVHRLLARIHGVPADPLTAAEICARRSDPLCGEALEMFCALLGSFAGNLALTLGARGGLYVGGFLPRIADVLRRSDFRRRFESKPPSEPYLRGIPTALITAPTPTLSGAAAHLANHLTP